MRRFWIIIVLFFNIEMTSLGAIDSLYVQSMRSFDTSQIEAYKTNPEFSYIHESQRTHWWEGLTEWLAQLLSEWFEGSDPIDVGSMIYTALKVIMWGLLFFAIGMLAYSLYKQGIFGVIGRKKKNIESFFTELEDQVMETDWQELISEAIALRQYNIATRLLFLQLLQTLGNAHFIDWHKSKSIRDYQRELNQDYKEGFTHLSTYYEYAWFGDVVIDESHFNQMREEFQAFNANLNVE